MLPTDVGLDKVAEKLKKWNISGLLIIGGFEVCLQQNQLIEDYVMLMNLNYLYCSKTICSERVNSS